jgi:hypothetical protein
LAGYTEVLGCTLQNSDYRILDDPAIFIDAPILALTKIVNSARDKLALNLNFVETSLLRSTSVYRELPSTGTHVTLNSRNF